MLLLYAIKFIKKKLIQNSIFTSFFCDANDVPPILENILYIYKNVYAIIFVFLVFNAIFFE